MRMPTRRVFLKTASAAAIAVSAPRNFAAASPQRVYVASSAPNGILAYDWNTDSGELTAAGVAAAFPKAAWITYSPDRRFIFSASELQSQNGAPFAEVASFQVAPAGLHPLSARHSGSAGTCQVGVDRTGSVLVAADYAGGSATSFLIHAGRLSPAVWSEHFTAHGPNPDRQQSPHPHFVSFSPDNRFVYVNDLGGDRIHIYRLNTATAKLTQAGNFIAKPGAGPRTLHFHPNGHTAYCINELASTVYVLEWSQQDGGLTQVDSIALLPQDYHGPTSACDTVISRDGRHVYFANRGDSSLYAFHADSVTGALTRAGRYDCGGKTPRHFVLDPTERWMLVANEDSDWITVFARDRRTGTLAAEGKNYPALTPMCILFR